MQPEQIDFVGVITVSASTFEECIQADLHTGWRSVTNTINTVQTVHRLCSSTISAAAWTSLSMQLSCSVICNGLCHISTYKMQHMCNYKQQ